ncbi:hypothetical protein KDJ56_07075 [Brevibacillus composti]|uniref:Uncharacterized protein n=1 Tax=Brevibacillus composti TaxID=2796470 RepID=A0A7T5EN54_9BACL|nr:hypothetical protein [Brevibacillus composti]QQE75693.1 hypothetical protein JD108_07395 [Brevibacillus composti]QUO42719.1 hypothetical protein KDJ56_07075 [Brevibacillus composti]
MLKEALQYLIGLGNAKIFNSVSGQEYASQTVHLLKRPTPDALVVSFNFACWAGNYFKYKTQRCRAGFAQYYSLLHHSTVGAWR